MRDSEKEQSWRRNTQEIKPKESPILFQRKPVLPKYRPSKSLINCKNPGIQICNRQPYVNNRPYQLHQNQSQNHPERKSLLDYRQGHCKPKPNNRIAVSDLLVTRWILVRVSGRIRSVLILISRLAVITSITYFIFAII